MNIRILTSSMIYLFVSVLQAILQISLLPIHTHFLSPSQYGVVATVMASALLCNILLNLGLHGAAQRYCADYGVTDQQKAQLWSNVLVLALSATLFMGLLLFGLISWLPVRIFSDMPNTPYLLFAVMNAMAMGVVLVGGELLRMQRQPGRYAMVFVGMYSAGFVLQVIFVALMKWQVIGALSAFALMPWFGCVLLLCLHRNHLTMQFDTKLMRSLLNYALKIMPHFVFSVMMTMSDRLLLMWFLGRQATGLYQAAAMIATGIPMITAAVGYAARPYIYQEFKKNNAEAFARVAHMVRIAVACIAVVGANVALWSPEILQLLTSSSYHAVWPVTVLLVLRHLLQGLVVFIICSVLYSKQHVHRLLFVSGSALLLLLLTSHLFAMQWGIYGVAVAILLMVCVYFVQIYWLAHRSFDMRWPLLQYLAIIFGFFVPVVGMLALLSYMHVGVFLATSSKLIFSAGSVLVCLALLQHYTQGKLRTAFKQLPMFARA